MRTYQTQFPKALCPPRPLLEALAALGFEDESYGNDVCPHWIHFPSCLKVWSNAKARDWREMGGFRYVVCRVVSRPDKLMEDDVEVAAFERTADVVAYLWAKLGTPTIQG